MHKMVLVVSLLAVAMGGCSREVEVAASKEEPVETQIEFSVYAAKDYSTPEYQQVEASLTLTAGVIDIETGAFIKKWDTLIIRNLVDFPVLEQSISIEKSIPLRLNKERLQVAHSIRYNNNGQLSQTANFETLPSGQVRHLKKIGL